MAAILTFLLGVFKWIPVLFINAVIIWSYYAYVVILCFESVQSLYERVVYLILYHPFFAMLMVSYWRTICASSGHVPSQFFLSRADRESLDNGDAKEILERVARKLPVVTQTVSGVVRYCDICQAIKPDRCHHCSMCQKCILKMDHHCPWVNNCVGFSNYKFFLLFLFYAILYTLFVTGTVTKYFVAFWNNSLEGAGKLHILFLFFVALMFCISLWSLFGYHLYLTANNKTTLESFRVPFFYYGPNKDGFSLGSTMKNAEQVLGLNRWYWFLPVFTSIGDGVNFPLLNQPEEDSLLNAQQRWMEEGELEAAPENRSNNVKQDSLESGIDASSAELVINESEVETQIHSSRTKPEILAVPDKNTVQNGTTL
ncbi:palmitoyltransferase ZDHHC15B-like isoform X2 [Acropora muricata]|uniref:palmitoyltransferase ZDHHC15B-like isoform X2 n=1 Tax=Acropora muricata TaxID=159855 RepID=UPI0034E4BE12